MKNAKLLLRYSLAIIYLWFGLLKLFGASPITSVLEELYPWLVKSNVAFDLFALLEISIGVGLILPRASRYASLALVGHLLISTLGILFSPMAFEGNFPNLTLLGEFVVKNFALMAAGLVIYSDQESALIQNETDDTK